MATDAQEAGLVYTLQSVMEGEAVTLVVHDYDGDWQFLTHGEFTTDDAVLMHPDHLYDADPTLCELTDLPMGRYAAREAVGGEWHFGSLDDGDVADGPELAGHDA